MPSFRLLFTAAIVVGSASCANPRTEANVAMALNDASNEIGALRNDIILLQTQIDSLRGVMMKQDTLINRIAAVNNIPR